MKCFALGIIKDGVGETEVIDSKFESVIVFSGRAIQSPFIIKTLKAEPVVSPHDG